MTRQRILLSPQQVAAKLGYSRSWLTDNRPQLEAGGFPKPVLGGGHGSPMRWDEYAIDLWLDSKLPAGLKDGARVTFTGPSARDVEQRLAQRAMEMSL